MHLKLYVIAATCENLGIGINGNLPWNLKNFGSGTIPCKSISDALDIVSQPPLCEEVEKIWVIGGSSVYKDVLELPNFYRLYLTRIKKRFDCDTFFPELSTDFVPVKDPNVPDGIQEENGIQFEYTVYERK